MTGNNVTDRIPSPAAYSTLIAITMVVALAVSATVGTVAIPAGAQESDDETGQYAVVQGDRCITVDSFGNGSRTVEEFYDYRTPETDPSSYSYSSFGTRHLQADDTSVFFLYEGRDGLSLVLVHGRLDGNSSGTALTMGIDGLPEDGEWAVEDDSYSEELSNGPFDEFDHDGTSSRITWASTDNRTDGAAFRGLDGEFEITIDPAFNDDADFRIYEGELTGWQAVSATDEGHERTSLEMDEPVTVRSGPCDRSPVTYDRTDDGLAVAVDGAEAGERFSLRLPNGSGDDVRFDGLELTADGESRSFTFENRRPESGLGAPGDGDALSYLAVTGDDAGADLPGTVSFAVEKRSLADRGLDPAGLALYEREVDRWREAPTTVSGETDDHYRFTANVSSVSTVAVAPRQPLEMTALEVDGTSVRAGDIVEVTAFAENPHDGERAFTATLAVAGEPVETKRVTVDPGDTGAVTFAHRFDEAGTYTIDVNGDRTEVVVDAEENRTTETETETETRNGSPAPGTGSGEEAESIPGFGVVAVIAALAALLWYAAGRERRS